MNIIPTPRRNVIRWGVSVLNAREKGERKKTNVTEDDVLFIGGSEPLFYTQCMPACAFLRAIAHFVSYFISEGGCTHVRMCARRPNADGALRTHKGVE